ncbi:hypothetical protein [Albimonas pacifica]|uniref:Holin n=1 Tax=Albimonas pacifica TaxID=1114924 RepID=A0A1I3JHK1_9RHOB|nr:hypothetical protein [Albimonas pacifica]SFI59753.1 hypothetical protein SAMN05216258_10812 [Albimonas pacifica]
MEAKPFWASKSIWAQVVALVATLTTMAGLDLGLTPEVQVAIVSAVQALVGIALRFKTNQPVR